MVCEQSFFKITLSEYHYQIYLNRSEHSEGKNQSLSHHGHRTSRKTSKIQQPIPPKNPTATLTYPTGGSGHFFLPNFQDILLTPSRAVLNTQKGIWGHSKNHIFCPGPPTIITV